MGIFSEFPDEKSFWNLRERIKQMFPFVKTVKFQRNLMKLQSTILLETMDGQIIGVVISDELCESKDADAAVLEQLKAAIAAQYAAPSDIYTPMDSGILAKFETEGPNLKALVDKFDYKKLEQKLLESYLPPESVFKANNYFTQQLNSISIEEIMQKYGNSYLSEEQKAIVQKKTWEYFHKPKNLYPLNNQGGVAGELSRYIPDLKTKIKCPECEHYVASLQQVIIHLNDIHGMSREYIADWLESTDLDIEFKEEVTK